MKRGKQPNITDALLDMPKDVGDLITTQRNKIPTITKGWTKINGAITFNDIFYSSPHGPGRATAPSIEAGKALSDSSGGRIGGFDHPNTMAMSEDQKRINSTSIRLIPRTHNECLQHLRRALPAGYLPGSSPTWLSTPPIDLYISPGASMKLLREKEEEGFEIEYDPIDRIGAASIKKKTNKKKKKKKKRN
jgi:hypothetical protein